MDDQEGSEPIAKPADRLFRLAENAVYTLVGVVLLASAVVVLVSVAYELATEVSHGVEKATTHALDGLLLVFILLELLAGVRATMVERKLVAEPFLVVGIIASIKEITVVALKAEGEQGSQRAFENSMIEIGVLGSLVLALAVAGILVRRKEREPDEG